MAARTIRPLRRVSVPTFGHSPPLLDLKNLTRRIWTLLLLMSALAGAGSAAYAQVTPFVPPPAVADSGRVVQGLEVDTARRAAADPLRLAAAPAPRAPVSLAGLSSLRTRWVRLDAPLRPDTRLDARLDSGLAVN